MRLRPPATAIYFRAFDPELGYGSSWRVRTGRTTNDVYLEHKEGGRWVHSSFHQSGENHYATTPRARKRGGPETPRYFGVEEERFAVAEGAFLLASIAVACSELTPDWQEHGTPATVIDVAIPSGTAGIGIDLYLIENPTLVVSVEGGVVALAECGGGAMLYIVSTPLRLDTDVQSGLADVVREIQARLRAEAWTQFPTRAVVSVKDPDAPSLQREVEVLITSDGS